MQEHDKDRRAFLKRTAAGVGAAAATGLLPDARSQAQTSQAQQSAAMPMARASNQLQGEGARAFFNMEDAATVAALAERIMPGAVAKAGANDANVLNYIDLALAGPYADQQEFYRHGLAQLDGYCNATYKNSFVALAVEQQNDVIRALEKGKATGFDWPRAQPFFVTLRTHTMEGMFADPVYGGNRDFSGWRLVGFRGGQEMFTQEDLASSEQFTRLPIIGMQD
jgi:gluconate 2-dehydrogenase gamma chain